MAQIQSGASADLLTIDPTAKAARALLYDGAGNPLAVKNGVNLPALGQAGLVIAGVNDGSSRVLRLDRFGNMRIGQEQLLFRDSAETGAVSGTPIAPNLGQWTTAVSGFAVGLPTVNGNQLTATTVTTSGAYAIATSQRQFQKMQKCPLFYRRRGRNVQVANTVSEFGFGAPSTTVAMVSNSAHWRFGSDGSVVPVLTYNNSEQVGTNIAGSLSNANYYTWDIIVDDDAVLFVCQDSQTGQSISEQTIFVSRAAPKVWSLSRLPIFERVYNSGTPASAPTILFSDVYVCSYDLFANKPWPQQIALASQGGIEVYPGAFVAANSQNANYANSAAPASATLSNTAAGYTTLGGQWQFAAVAGAETDYALFGFTVPTGFTLAVTGIHISTFNMGAAVATTPTLLQWGVANNSSAVSLATAGLTRLALGAQSLAVGAAVGAVASPDLDVTFDAPLITHGGRIFHIILKMPVGTATASQVVRGVAAVKGYFE